MTQELLSEYVMRSFFQCFIRSVTMCVQVSTASHKDRGMGADHRKVCGHLDTTCSRLFQQNMIANIARHRHLFALYSLKFMTAATS